MLEYRADYKRAVLDFKFPAITSRAVMQHKETFLLKLSSQSSPEVFGVGEVPLFRGLSAEDTTDFEYQLRDFCSDFSLDNIPEISSIRFGVESAVMDLQRKCNPVTESFSYRINGLVWMGDKNLMASRIREKLEAGFSCLKLKIGGLDFEDELSLLDFIRSKFPPDLLEIRLDANGAFSPENALSKLYALSAYSIHSIEQPIKARQWKNMAYIVANSPIRIALDEELIGFHNRSFMEEMLNEIHPDFIILKPALCGGFAQADEWISVAQNLNIGWWATSALESNIGLTAIALWLRKYQVTLPQGLGTGQLYYNNYPSPLSLDGEVLTYNSENVPIWNF